VRFLTDGNPAWRPNTSIEQHRRASLAKPEVKPMTNLISLQMTTFGPAIGRLAPSAVMMAVAHILMLGSAAAVLMASIPG
jgi:hypothetical protein